jgi:hypothetical protein
MAAAKRRRGKTALNADEPRRRGVCPSCGFYPEHLTPDKRIPEHSAPRGGRCRGTEDKPARAVLPPWLQPGHYAPAFGAKKTGVNNAAPPPRVPGTRIPKLTRRSGLPDSRADSDRVRQPGTVSGGAPSLGRRH